MSTRFILARIDPRMSAGLLGGQRQAAWEVMICPIKAEGQPESLSPPTMPVRVWTSSQLYPPSSSTSTFEFTKRKHWADLITELTETVILIFSTRCQILYCGTAVKELLGWRNEDLIDTKFLDLVNGTLVQSVESLIPL